MGDQLIIRGIDERDSNVILQIKQKDRDFSATVAIWCGPRGIRLPGSLMSRLTNFQLCRALNVANNVAFLPSNNQHLDTPQAVSNICTGRGAFLEDIRSILLLPTADATDGDIQSCNAQKRFVIYGLGGAGKPQFCCKFAQDNRERLIASEPRISID